jgi:hypothetical protein
MHVHFFYVVRLQIRLANKHMLRRLSGTSGN